MKISYACAGIFALCYIKLTPNMEERTTSQRTEQEGGGGRFNPFAARPSPPLWIRDHFKEYPFIKQYVFFCLQETRVHRGSHEHSGNIQNLTDVAMQLCTPPFRDIFIDPLCKLGNAI